MQDYNTVQRLKLCHNFAALLSIVFPSFQRLFFCFLSTFKGKNPLRVKGINWIGSDWWSATVLDLLQTYFREINNYWIFLIFANSGNSWFLVSHVCKNKMIIWKCFRKNIKQPFLSQLYSVHEGGKVKVCVLFLFSSVLYYSIYIYYILYTILYYCTI